MLSTPLIIYTMLELNKEDIYTNTELTALLKLLDEMEAADVV